MTSVVDFNFRNEYNDFRSLYNFFCRIKEMETGLVLFDKSFTEEYTKLESEYRKLAANIKQFIDELYERYGHESDVDQSIITCKQNSRMIEMANHWWYKYLDEAKLRVAMDEYSKLRKVDPHFYLDVFVKRL